MSNIKKAFAPLVAFLQTKADHKVKTILDEVITMCEAKTAGSAATTAHRNENNEVTHIRCGYFGLWLPLSHVVFAPKANSASGYNTMCKEGQAAWTKKQRDAKKAKEQVLTDLASGEISQENLNDILAEIEATRISREGHVLGRETLEDALALTTDELDQLVAEAQEAAMEDDADVEDSEAVESED